MVVLDSIGEAHGYAIMGELEARVGGGWKPSPGAIYPALLKLVDQGHVKAIDRDETVLYSLTPKGHRQAGEYAASGRWASLQQRADDSERRVTVGSLLDVFAAENPLRRRLPSIDQQRKIESILNRASDEIEHELKEEDNG